MSDVVILGVGQTPVGEHYDQSLAHLAYQAVRDARREAGGLLPQVLYIGNFMAATASRQANLGALLATDLGLVGIEATTVEAGSAAGGAALHMGYLAISSGMVDVALVVGVEKYTDIIGPATDAVLAQMLDSDYEAMLGMTPAAQAGILMKRYLHETGAPRQAFAGFAVTSHANAANNPNAMFRRAITAETYERAEVVVDPMNMYDIAPYGDGAAALVLANSRLIPAGLPHRPVRITGSSLVTETLALHDRPDPLGWRAAGLSVERACRQAGMLPGDASFFEYDDAFSIYAALSLEAAGFARRGEGWKLAHDGALSLDGRLPAATMGGSKGRGNPIAAVGVYQAVEAVLQLRGAAGKNQVAGARRGLIQSLGGAAATAVTHVLEI